MHYKMNMEFRGKIKKEMRKVGKVSELKAQTANIKVPETLQLWYAKEQRQKAIFDSCFAGARRGSIEGMKFKREMIQK